MKTYTREQLISAMEKYYANEKENPTDFKNVDSDEENAIGCIDYLIELIND